MSGGDAGVGRAVAFQTDGPMAGLHQPTNAYPPFWPGIVILSQRARQIWRNDLVRLIGLTIYYLAIIVGLAILYGGAEYTPPPFIYQGF